MGKPTNMTWQAILTLITIVGMLVTLVSTKIATDLVLVGTVSLLFTFGVIDFGQAFGGFANEGMLTVAVLFVVASALRETGAINSIVEPLLGRPKSVLSAQLRMMFPVAAFSAFVNNTPIVAMLVPVIGDWAKKNRISPSKLMIPLSYATILGGTCTVVGTSTNLIVNGLLMDYDDGRQGLSLFAIAPVGIPAMIVGLLYLAFFSRWLLPERKPPVSRLDDPREYIVEMMIEVGSPLEGKTIEQAGLRHLPGMYLVEIAREDELLPAVSPTEKLRGGDRLVFAGIVETVVDLQKIRGLVPATDQVFKLNAPREQRCLVEAVVSNSHPLLNKTIRDGKFRTVYDAAIIAVMHDGERVRKKIGDIILKAGDTLLLEADPSFVEKHRNTRDYFLVSTIQDSAPPRHDRAWLSLGILLGMVIVAGLGWLSMFNAALLAAGAMLASGCISMNVARRSIAWEVLVAIGASFGIGKALEVSGGAEFIANNLISMAGSHPWVALGMLYFVTLIFTEILSNNAAAVLVFPLAMATALTLEVSSMPFIITIMMAASAGFATPMGYQTHLMVYGPGGYHYTDYVKIGVPLDILIGIVTVTLAPLIWPFTG